MGESGKGMEKSNQSSPTSNCIPIFHARSKSSVEISADLV